MPFEFVPDDAKRRLRVTLSDPLTLAELIAAVERQLQDGAWLYGSLIDARRLILFTPKPSEMQLFVSRVRDLVAANGPRGPVAIISRHTGVISGTQMFNSFGGQSEAVQVFWDMDEAEQFLDRRTELPS